MTKQVLEGSAKNDSFNLKKLLEEGKESFSLELDFASNFGSDKVSLSKGDKLDVSFANAENTHITTEVKKGNLIITGYEVENKTVSYDKIETEYAQETQILNYEKTEIKVKELKLGYEKTEVNYTLVENTENLYDVEYVTYKYNSSIEGENKWEVVKTVKVGQITSDVDIEDEDITSNIIQKSGKTVLNDNYEGEDFEEVLYEKTTIVSKYENGKWIAQEPSVNLTNEKVENSISYQAKLGEVAYGDATNKIDKNILTLAGKEVIEVTTTTTNFTYQEDEFKVNGEASNSSSLIIKTEEELEDTVQYQKYLNGEKAGELSANAPVNETEEFITNNKIGSLTLLGYANKDLGAIVTIDGKDYIYEDTFAIYDDFSKKTSITGTALKEEFDASGYFVEKENWTKGVTINAKDGANEITGSRYNDKITAGNNNDTVTATSGDDTYKLGLGENEIMYENPLQGKDTINLTKGEKLEINIEEENLAVKVQGKDLAIIGENGSVVLKNYATKDVLGADGSIVVNDSEEALDLENIIYTESDFNSKGALNISSRLDSIIDLSETEFENIKTVKITTSKGSDEITLASNQSFSVNAKDGNNIISVVEGENYTQDFVNKITTGKDVDTFNIEAGLNTISTGAGNDIINIDGGVNKITTASGNNSFNINGGYTTISSGKGNDTYNFSNFANQEANSALIFSGVAEIKDKGGVDTIILDEDILSYDGYTPQGGEQEKVNDNVFAFFNVKLGKNNKFSYDSTDVTLTTKLNALEVIYTNFDEIEDNEVKLNGISFNSKTIENIQIGEKLYDLNLDEIASSVASWLDENGYKSAEAVLDSGNTDDINALIAAYQPAEAEIFTERPIV